MNTDTLATVRAALAAAGPTAFLPDDPQTIESTGLQPEELWAVTSAPAFNLVVLSRSRTARDLYRVLALVERLVQPGGRILILPYAPPGNAVAENRFEATEAFLGVYPGWTRCLRGGNVVELRKGATVDADADSGASRLDSPMVASVDGGREAPLSTMTTGTGKRVISLAVFGAGGYWTYLPAFVRAHHALFPGYELRVHHDDGIFNAPYGATLFGLQARGLVRLVNMPSHEGMGKCAKMLWRLAPAWDDTVDFVFSRDVDGLPTYRERRATEEFVASALDGEVEAWTVHDSLSHAGMMGGLCGFNALSLRALAPSFEDFLAAAGFDDERWAQHGADQDYINARVAPKLRIFEHSVFLWLDEDGKTRRYRKPTDWGDGRRSVRFVTELPAFDDPRVPADIRDASDRLINHMGTAGFPLDRALTFYATRCPVIEQIAEAEREAGETALGAG